MYMPKDIDDFFCPYKFTCPDCNSPYRIDSVGVSINGRIVAEVECLTCQEVSAIYLKYDLMLIASETELVKRIRAPGQPKRRK